MKCPNCSAVIAPGAAECEFCGHRITSVTDYLAQNKIPSMPSVSASPSVPQVENPAPSSVQAATVVMNSPSASAPVSAPPPSPPPTENPYQNHSQASNKNDIPNHMVWAVISTVFATFFSMCTCCFIPFGLPSGIAAIVFANQVNNFLSMGDVHGAQEASKKAKLWSQVTTGIAVVFGLWFVLSMILNFAGLMADGSILEQIRSDMGSNR